MAKKRRVTIRPWCWYCERDFDSEKILIEHQRKRHYTCLTCDKKHKTLAYLMEHSLQEHKNSIKTVPYALPGRDSIEIIVRGTEGIPEKDIIVHSKKIEAQFEEEQMYIRKLPSGELKSSEDSSSLGIADLVAAHTHEEIAPTQITTPTVFQGQPMPPPMPPGYPAMIYPPRAHNGVGPYGHSIYGPVPPIPFNHMNPHGFPPQPPYPVSGIRQKVPYINHCVQPRYSSPLRPDHNPQRVSSAKFRPRVDLKPLDTPDSIRRSFDGSPLNSMDSKRPHRPQAKDSPQSTDSRRGPRFSRSNFEERGSRDSRRLRNSFNSRTEFDHGRSQPREPVEKIAPRPKMTPIFKHPVNNLFSPHAFSPPRQTGYKATKSSLRNSLDDASSEGALQRDNNSSSSKRSELGCFASLPSLSKLDSKHSSASLGPDFTRRVSSNKAGFLAHDSPSGLHLDPDFILDEAQPFDEFSVQENEKIICTEKEISLEELRASDERYVYSDVALKRRIDDLNASVDKHVAFIRKLAR